MITAQFIETMALYNKWQNQNLLAICDKLTPNEMNFDRRMFFGSIFKTLNHIINVDEYIHIFIHSKNLLAFDLNFIPYLEYDEFKIARYDFDEKLVRESQSCSQIWLDDLFEFWSERFNRQRKVPRSFYYIQMFNHQTHHRSQITSELHKMGIDYGSTDIPYNPYYQF